MSGPVDARATGWWEALAVCCGNGYIVLQSSPESHYIKERAGVAQLVERGPEEPGVGGSTPSPGTMSFPAFAAGPLIAPHSVTVPNPF